MCVNEDSGLPRIPNDETFQAANAREGADVVVLEPKGEVLIGGDVFGICAKVFYHVEDDP